jgi:hypothetical protein
MNAYYQLSKSERREMSGRITRGEVQANDDTGRDSFEFELESGRTVRGSYGWGDDNPTEWELEVK